MQEESEKNCQSDVLEKAKGDRFQSACVGFGFAKIKYVSEDHQNHPQADDSPGGLYKTQHEVVLLMVMIYYSERIQSKIGKEKRCMG